MTTMPESRQTAVLGGGCFWCLEAVFDQLAGVQSVESGYAGGRNANPTYEAVCGGATGHAGVIMTCLANSGIRSRITLRAAWRMVSSDTAVALFRT